jgi:hypothetical protein
LARLSACPTTPPFERRPTIPPDMPRNILLHSALGLAIYIVVAVLPRWRRTARVERSQGSRHPF